MEEETKSVIWKEKAEKSLQDIYLYIYQDSPVNALKYYNKLIYFGKSFANFPEKYPICKQKILSIRKLRCAVFDKSYIFVYKKVKNTVVIYNVIHGKTNPTHFTV